jgi:prepilin-type N-terminal cleavage/methylation domain-containing protein
MKRRRAFTLIELLVVISIIALLLAILVPSLRKARKYAQSVVCVANLKHWGLCWYLYTDDNGGRFPTGSSAGGAAFADWPDVLRPYYVKEGALALCPTATKPYSSGGSIPFGAWSWGTGQLWTGNVKLKSIDYGSYGLNEYINDRPGNDSKYWRTREVKNPDRVPLFFDCAWYDIYPYSESLPPPQFEGELSNEMSLVCINRHDGFINSVFVDFNIRSIGLKELWRLKWTRTWNTNNTWTGRDAPWPEWMRRFKDYAY